MVLRTVSWDELIDSFAGMRFPLPCPIPLSFGRAGFTGRLGWLVGFFVAFIYGLPCVVCWLDYGAYCILLSRYSPASGVGDRNSLPHLRVDNREVINLFVIGYDAKSCALLGRIHASTVS